MQLGRYAAMQLFRNKCFQNGATVFCVVGTQEFRNDFSTSLSSWFQSALNKNALPVPMLRQVHPDPPDMVFSHVFIAIITKSREN